MYSSSDSIAQQRRYSIPDGLVGFLAWALGVCEDAGRREGLDKGCLSHRQASFREGGLVCSPRDSAELDVPVVLGPHCGGRFGEQNLLLPLSLLQSGGLRVALLGRVGACLWLCEVTEVGTNGALEGRTPEEVPAILQFGSLVRPNPDDEDSPAGLGNTNVLALDELMLDLVPSCPKVLEDGGDSPGHREKTVDILGHEDDRLDPAHDLHEGLVEGPTGRVKSLALPSVAEVLAGKATRDHVCVGEGIVLLQEVSDVSQDIRGRPTVELGQLLCLGKDVILEDRREGKPLQVHKALRLGRRFDILRRDTLLADNDLLREAHVHPGHSGEERQDSIGHLG